MSCILLEDAQGHNKEETMKPLIGVVLVCMGLSGAVCAAEPGQEQAEPHTKEGQAQPTVTQNASAVSSTTPQTSTPLPPGLQTQGTVPHGLEKQGKTPHGWSQGKAWWKLGTQSPQTAASPSHHQGRSQGHAAATTRAAHGHH